MPETFTTPNGIKHITLSATPGEQTEVNLHHLTRSIDVEFFTTAALTTSAAGQVAFTGADAMPIGANKWRPVAPNTDWPVRVRFPESKNAILKVYLSSLAVSPVVVFVSFEAPQ